MRVTEEQNDPHTELHVIEEHLPVVCTVPEYETDQQRTNEVVEHLYLQTQLEHIHTWVGHLRKLNLKFEIKFKASLTQK